MLSGDVVVVYLVEEEHLDDLPDQPHHHPLLPLHYNLLIDMDFMLQKRRLMMSVYRDEISPSTSSPTTPPIVN